MRNFLIAAAALLTASCASASRPVDPQQAFFQRLLSLCGQTLEGRIVSPPVAADADFAGKRLVMHVRDCSPQEIRIPFHVGEDRSRTWVVTRTGTGLQLKHDHRHNDGSEDKLSQYGGVTAIPGTVRRQEFPADDFSKELFVREAIPQSVPTSGRWRSSLHHISHTSSAVPAASSESSSPKSPERTMLARRTGRAYIGALSSTS